MKLADFKRLNPKIGDKFVCSPCHSHREPSHEMTLRAEVNFLRVYQNFRGLEYIWVQGSPGVYPTTRLFPLGTKFKKDYK